MRCPLTPSAGNALSVVSWVMGTANWVKGRAVVILSVDATHLLMAGEVSDVPPPPLLLASCRQNTLLGP